MSELHACSEPGCSRQFLDMATLQEHAEAVHTFDDIRQTVSDAIRETYGRRSTDELRGIYVWLVDIADDWVVFSRDENGDISLQKVAYSIIDGKVSFGTPVEVTRKTVYEPVKAGN